MFCTVSPLIPSSRSYLLSEEFYLYTYHYRHQCIENPFFILKLCEILQKFLLGATYAILFFLLHD
jgi:hypothetical protein